MLDSREALDQLYRLHRHQALGLARRVLRDPRDAEDVVQEIFAHLLTRPAAFEGRSSFGTWLHRVVLNRSLNALRTRKRLPPGHPGHLERAVITPEEHALQHERARSFLRALARLGARHRRLVWMRDVLGLDYAEIAQRLGVAEGTVKSGLSRARAALQGHLDDPPESSLARAARTR